MGGGGANQRLRQSLGGKVFLLHPQDKLPWPYYELESRKTALLPVIVAAGIKYSFQDYWMTYLFSAVVTGAAGILTPAEHFR